MFICLSETLCCIFASVNNRIYIYLQGWANNNIESYRRRFGAKGITELEPVQIKELLRIVWVQDTIEIEKQIK